METIRNYLDSMFANYPNTPSVLRAKDELWQMMEDKYNELVVEGKSENEAIGTIISEFGNLNELAETLGLREEVKTQESHMQAETTKRLITTEEAQGYIAAKKNFAFHCGLGVCFLIASLASFTMADFFSVGLIGLIGFCTFIVAGIIMIALSGSEMAKWKFIQTHPCTLSMETTKMVADEGSNCSYTTKVERTVGIVLCALCWIPAVIFDEYIVLANGEALAGTALFFLVGIGVMLIIHSAQIDSAYKTLLRVNGTDTVKANYQPANREVAYSNPVIAAIMSVYWPTIICIYLMLSFVTNEWGLTWLIWPVAAIASTVVHKLCANQ